jgi:hypothetical protein
MELATLVTINRFIKKPVLEPVYETDLPALVNFLKIKLI